MESASTTATEKPSSLPIIASTGSENHPIVDKKSVHATDVAEENAIDDVPEYLDELRSKNALIGYPSLSKDVYNKELQDGHITLRSQQAMLHVGLTHVRINELETQLASLKSHVFNRPKEDTSKKKEIKYPVHQREVRRSTMETFQVSEPTREVPLEKCPALEAFFSQDKPLMAAGDVKPHSQPVASSENSHIPLAPGQQTPERLRIRSTPLLILLQQVTGERVFLNEVATYDDRTIFRGFTILRPFKIFAKHEKSIRESLLHLESHIQKQRQGSASDGEKKKKKSLYASTNSSFIVDDEDMLADARLLIEFFDNDLRPTLDLKQRISNRTASDIEFADLWHLFELGAIVVYEADETRAYRVLRSAGGREPLTEIMDKQEDRVPALDGFVVDCTSLTFNGLEFVPVLHKFTIPKFHGLRPISSLPVYPLAFHQNAHTLSEELRNRGKEYMSITAPPFSHLSMRGRTLDEPSHDVDAPVIVDMAAALNIVSNWKSPLRIETDRITKPDPRETHLAPNCKHGYRNIEGCCGRDIVHKDQIIDLKNFAIYVQNNGRLLGPRKESELTEDDFLLLSDRVHAFILRNRQWVTAKVVDLSQMSHQDNFDKLMLPERHKTSILALVKTHENSRQGGGASIGAGLDLVKGKGTGLILLLHGEPGVGKTSTAECVADSTRRPLYPITCGDVGETATEVEKNLAYNFRLAHKWGCVLLLDEADVFLAKRSKTDLRRNAVTSVFLRSLEYYAGILFLTTNRVGGIDPAFKSRIHLSLFYPRLKRDETVKLYKTFIQRTKDEQKRLGTSAFHIDKKQITEFARKHYREMEHEGLGTWNGRQIRNAFQAAIALVEHESQQYVQGTPKPTLGAAQFRTVAQSSKEFDRYLISTLGAGESDMAIRDEWRADRFPNVVQQSYAGGNPNPGRSHRSKGRSSRMNVEMDTEDTSTGSDASENDTDSNGGDS